MLGTMPRDRWSDDRIDDLARRHDDDLRGIRAELRDHDTKLDALARPLTRAQILGFIVPILIALIGAVALVLAGTP